MKQLSKLKQARQKWTNFLREEGRQKTKERLEDYDNPEARCCLGHAAHVLGATRETDDKLEHVYYDGCSGDLSARLCKTLNITDTGAFHRRITIAGYGNHRFSSIATVNDLTDLKPAELADIIDQQFEKRNFRAYKRVF